LHSTRQVTHSRGRMAAPDECQSIYWSLLLILEGKTANVSAAHYLREWDETKRCDAFHDLSRERKSVETKMTVGAMTRIRDFGDGPQDADRALQTMIHYREWHRKSLMRALSWQNAVYFYIQKPSR
jgi:hypothetical protein